MTWKEDSARIRAEMKKEEAETKRLGAIPCVICGARRIPQIAHNPELGMMCIHQDTHEEERLQALKIAIVAAENNQVSYIHLVEAARLATKDEKQADIVRFVEVCQKVGTEDSYKAALTVVSFPYQYGGLEGHIQEIEQHPDGTFFPMGFAFGWKY